MDFADRKRIEVIQTDDGSSSLFVPNLNETYHSRHGALREAIHVFIENGMHDALKYFSSLRIMEIGFGTGLNAWLTCKESRLRNMKVHYTALEPYPLEKEIYTQLNYADKSDDIQREMYDQLHQAKWNEDEQIKELFTLQKVSESLQHYSTNKKFDLVYYDAFGPPAQPEMWEKQVFEKIYGMMAQSGILVTYCAKGQVRRDMQACGFEVERLQGPPGKREMLRARKN